MNKLALLLASLLACASVACSAAPPESSVSDEEVNVEVESNVDTQAMCTNRYEGACGREFTSLTTCRSQCGTCWYIGRCCGNGCSWK